VATTLAKPILAPAHERKKIVDGPKIPYKMGRDTVHTHPLASELVNEKWLSIQPYLNVLPYSDTYLALSNQPTRDRIVATFRNIYLGMKGHYPTQKRWIKFL
jgi:hypothetical protein